MSWRRVAVIYAVLAVLTGYVIVFERGEPETATTVPLASTASLLGTDAASVTAVTFRNAGQVVRAARENQRWRAVEPPEAKVSPDLIEATIATLTAGQASEKLSPEPENALSAYGLDAPSAVVEVVIANTTDPVTILLGARNPTRTAVYARRTDQPAIFLVGMNASYYIDLIFDAAKR